MKSSLPRPSLLPQPRLRGPAVALPTSLLALFTFFLGWFYSEVFTLSGAIFYEIETSFLDTPIFVTPFLVTFVAVLLGLLFVMFRLF